MPGILEYELQDYQDAARQYRSELLRLPILSLDEELSVMTLRPGIRHSEVVGSSNIDVELQPYVRNAVQDANLNLVHRELHTYFGTVNAEFEPNAEISTLLGHRASQASGDALATTPQAHEVIAGVPKSIGRKLKTALFTAVRNPKGKKTTDLFNGFDTIAQEEITAGNIADSVGNYLKLSAVPDKLNATDIAQEILDSMSPELRGTQCNLYCDQKFYDAYVRAYKMESGGIAYNTSYDQTYVEGSRNLLRIVPLVGKAGSRFIQVCPASNMLVGCDQLSDKEQVRIGNYSPDTFMVMMRMFFGAQYESIDPRRFLLAEIPA